MDTGKYHKHSAKPPYVSYILNQHNLKPYFVHPLFEAHFIWALYSELQLFSLPASSKKRGERFQFVKIQIYWQFSWLWNRMGFVGFWFNEMCVKLDRMVRSYSYLLNTHINSLILKEYGQLTVQWSCLIKKK